MSDQYIPTFLCTGLVFYIGKLQIYFVLCVGVQTTQLFQTSGFDICVVTPLLKANFGVFIVAAQMDGRNGT